MISAWDTSYMFHKTHILPCGHTMSHIPLNPMMLFDYVIIHRWLSKAHTWQLPCLGAPDDSWTPMSWSLVLLHRWWVQCNRKTNPNDIVWQMQVLLKSSWLREISLKLHGTIMMHTAGMIKLLEPLWQKSSHLNTLASKTNWLKRFGMPY